MINIKHLNKYFYKDTNREIHVINDVSLELPDNGFVSILGQSGSGKTTLLNVIGGLDNFHDGTIDYNGNVFDASSFSKLDEYRKEKIGYIFQNYLLDENDTVYNNLKKVLDISSILSNKEQSSRIEYALKAVGLEKYKKKLAKNLSGGQMQRVAIARALVKNVDIILADEPTGNIDSENTIIIMNILKKISKTKLVLLITHEDNVAKFYSDRIIEYVDGKVVNDYANSNTSSLEVQNERTIHLRDYEKEECSVNGVKTIIYKDEASVDASLEIVFKNNTFYIKSNKKIVNINESSISFADDKYSDVEQTVDSQTTFDNSFYNDEKSKSSLFARIWSGLKEAFLSLYRRKKVSKFFSFIFVILGAVMSYAAIKYVDFNKIDTSDIITSDDYYVITNDDSYDTTLAPINDSSIYLDLIKNNKIKSINVIDTISTYCSYKINFIEDKTSSLKLYTKLYDESFTLLYGSAPTNETFVIGKKAADKVLSDLGLEVIPENYQYISLSSSQLNCSGVADVDTDYCYLNAVRLYTEWYYSSSEEVSVQKKYIEEHYTVTNGSDIVNENEILVNKSFLKDNDLLSSEIIGQKINFTYRDENYNEKYYEVQVVGVCELDSTILEEIDYVCNDAKYMSYEIYNNYGSFQTYHLYVYSNAYVPYEEISNYATIVEGSIPVNEYEAVSSIYSDYCIGDRVDGYTIVGLYSIDYSKETSLNLYDYESCMLVSLNDVLSNNDYAIVIEPNEETHDYLTNLGYKLWTLKEYQTNVRLENKHQTDLSTLTTIIIMVLSFVLYSYFSNRSKMISDIYDIGLNRALGRTKGQIMTKYVYFSIVQTTFSCVLGYLIVFIGYVVLKTKFTALFGEYVSHPWVFILGVLLMYLINIISGILPIFFLTRKTPSQILSKYDI